MDTSLRKYFVFEIPNNTQVFGTWESI